jgi:hypothetical protein
VRQHEWLGGGRSLRRDDRVVPLGLHISARRILGHAAVAVAALCASERVRYRRVAEIGI